ncbi:asparagine synthetase B [Taibaiella soli]|uniref:Asparagine synthetase B n=1 Tax=Taibaiella soli TaxID=1649169 RepID=A0A2W2C332_9BACT|nr:asparagine synthetase B [Taibaiella soli]PZF74513.1 asparagine synthetase B [Taibaiella soli]
MQFRFQHIKLFALTTLFLCAGFSAFAAKIFIPMDAETQTNHLKAYGIAYAALKQGVEVDWLLNYKGGSFGMDETESMERLCKLRGVDYQVMSDAQYGGILNEIANPDFNGDVIKLEKAPKIAVYTPPNKLPWDDAVTMVLTYAEIPYDKIYDDEVLDNKLATYDWLHLHHEDFTGQYGKFWGAYRGTAWYQEDVRTQEAMAAKHGYKKVSQLKLAVAKKIQGFVAGGGYLFAMCSATDSYDIAVAAQNTDICDVPFDGDPIAPNAQQMLDYTQCFAFKDFKLSENPYEYEFSNIDNTNFRRVPMESDYFSLFTFSAKFDPVPTMLCQDHTTTIKGFMGQTTSFRKEVLKTSVLVMGDNKAANEARYIHGEYGKGTWTFYGGHDPEDYQHAIGDPPTDLSLHPTSPGYRLILNNVLFPAAKKKPRKT